VWIAERRYGQIRNRVSGTSLRHVPMRLAYDEETQPFLARAARSKLEAEPELNRLGLVHLARNETE
jgi:hypothetical protein